MVGENLKRTIKLEESIKLLNRLNKNNNKISRELLNLKNELNESYIKNVRK